MIDRDISYFESIIDCLIVLYICMVSSQISIIVITQILAIKSPIYGALEYLGLYLLLSISIMYRFENFKITLNE